MSDDAAGRRTADGDGSRRANERGRPTREGDLVSSISQALDAGTRVEFDRRVAEQALRLARDCRNGRLDTGDYAVGIELEAYAVDSEGRPTAVPEQVFEDGECGKELGVHNVELHTDPDRFTEAGLRNQRAALRERYERTRDSLAGHGCELVLDAMWTVPPVGGTPAYLGTVEEIDGLRVARNMRTDARYHALDNETLRRAGGAVNISVPGVDRDFPSILVESLATSMQPHLQVPSGDDFPAYFNTAIRTLGPVLALATNSPFLPADFYDEVDGDTARRIVDETPHELRVAVFEGSMNAAAPPGAGKVRVPPDLETLEEVVTRLVADETYAPFLDVPNPEEEYPDPFPELTHKRGTYWRWVRAVLGGEIPRGSDGDDLRASVRLEYRPLPTQPTVDETMALDVLVVGLLRGLVTNDHPLPTLSWSVAEETFYRAVGAGLDADFAWVDAAGERTMDTESIYEEVFEYARRGLADAGFDDAAADEFLRPIERRYETGRTPSRWKKAAVRARLDDGDSLPDAIVGMQQAYYEHASGDPVVEWPWPGSDDSAR
jgi:gamma-glutamyl:cysteine ligase YbdK (ATP-grasp superfamily)